MVFIPEEPAVSKGTWTGVSSRHPVTEVLGVGEGSPGVAPHQCPSRKRSPRAHSEEVPQDSAPRLRATAGAGSRGECGGAAAPPAPEGGTARHLVEAGAATPRRLTGAEGGECCGLSCVPQVYVEVNPAPQNVTVFGERVCTKVTEVK